MHLGNDSVSYRSKLPFPPPTNKSPVIDGDLRVNTLFVIMGVCVINDLSQLERH